MTNASNKSGQFSFSKCIRSFGHAINGLKILLKEEGNARVHIVIAAVVVALGFVFDIAAYEWLAICILIALVLSLEIINSAIENICDHVSPSWHETIKKVKDLSAAAVLVATTVSVACGIIIFVPKIATLIF